MTNHINSQSASPASLEDNLPASFSFIGELARRSGVSTMAIRFYEREGLLAPRRVGRFRTYNEDDEQRLKLIVRLRQIGLPVVKVRAALALAARPASPDYAQLLQEHFADLCRKRDELACQIAHTSAFLRELGGASDGAAGNPGSKHTVALASS
jgi:DNA-binding transcriptional MerR regulator